MSKQDELQQQVSSEHQHQPLEESNDSDKVYLEADVMLLEEILNVFLIKHDFKKAQIVKWKSGLRNKKYPFENQPAIVVDILNPPLINEEDSGTPYFREPMDILLGFIHEDGDFDVLHYDSRRFEPYETK